MCTLPSVSDSSSVTASSLSVEGKLTVTCPNGYHLNSTDTVTCTNTADGNDADWEPYVPTCGKSFTNVKLNVNNLICRITMLISLYDFEVQCVVA